MLSRQPCGEEGDILVNGCANMFYVRDSKGNLRAVDAYWRAVYGDWDVHAYPVEHPDEWNVGFQVVSRN